MATTSSFLRTRPFKHHPNGKTPDGHTAPGASGPAPRTSRLGTVTAVAALGVFVDAVAYALARSSHSGPTIPLFLVGLIVLYVPCAWRLTSTTATRHERVGVSVVLGAGMLVAYILRSPLIFDGFDELLHGATLAQLMSGHSLLAHNTALPVSPYFPGLELLTTAVKWLTGLPLVLAESVVLLATRIVLMLCVFLVVERVCGSARAGGIGVLVYASNPQFFAFDSQFAYETLALAFAVGAVHLIITSIKEQPRVGAPAGPVGPPPPLPPTREPLLGEPRASVPLLRLGYLSGALRPGERPPPPSGYIRPAPFLLAMACLAALVVTHHLTGWLTVGFLVVGALLLQRSHRPVPAGTVWATAIIGLAIVGSWSALVGSRLWSYLGPIFNDAASGLSRALAQLHSNRKLFHAANGGPASPKWEIVLMLAAAAAWCVVLIPAVRAAVKERTVGGGSLRWAPILIACAYPVALVTSVSSMSSEVGQRATTFIFFGMAVVVGGWLAARIIGKNGRRWSAGIVVVASAALIGTVLFGSGPDWSLVPGKYLVGADQRSVTAPSLAMAQWASTHIAPDSHVAADRDNGVLLADLARVEPVTAIGGLVNASPLYFDRTVGSFDISLIRQAQIRYIVIDDRLASGLPLYGTYVEPGEPTTQLTMGQLDKFATVPGVRRVYDNGPIQIYDLSAILGTPAPAPGKSQGTPTGTDIVVLVAALCVGALVLVRIRRRRSRLVPSERAVVRWVIGAMVAGIAFGAVCIAIHTSARVVGLAGLAAIALFTLVVTWGAGTDPLLGTKKDGPGVFVTRRDGRRVLAWTAAGFRVLAAAVLLSAAVAVAVVSARGQFDPPDQLTVSAGANGTTATVQLATPTAGARLVVTGPSGVELSHPLAPTTAPQTVAVPPSSNTAGTDVKIVVARAVVG